MQTVDERMKALAEMEEALRAKEEQVRQLAQQSKEVVEAQVEPHQEVVAPAFACMPEGWSFVDAANIGGLLEERAEAAAKLVFGSQKQRAMQYQWHCLPKDRMRLPEAQIKHHYGTFETDSRLTTIYGVLNVFAQQRLSGSPPMTVAVLGSAVGSDLEKVGAHIYDQMISNAGSRLAPDILAVSQCCHVCSIRPRTEHVFLPEFVDAFNVLGCRLVALCSEQVCLDALLEQIGNDQLAGFRVFFAPNNAIWVCEDADDVHKFGIGC